MAGSAAQGGPGLAPPPQEQQGQPGMPGHMQAPGAPGFNAPPAPPHNPFAYGGQPQGPGVNGYGPQAPQPTASPGPGKPRVGGGRLDGLATPQQSQTNPYPGSPSVARPTPPPSHQAPPPQPAQDGYQYTDQELHAIGNKLSELDVNKLSPSHKRSGEDWHAVFNPRAMRRLDVDLVHNLVHQSVVCCVRFSHDGKYVATGCNRSAQIFDVVTGQQICHLTDNTANQDGDLYIRSVCFSPDGRYLATGAEDRIIRVSFPDFSEDIACLTKSNRSGKLLPSASCTNLLATSKTFTRLTSPPMAATLPQAPETVPSGCGTFRRTSAS